VRVLSIVASSASRVPPQSVEDETAVDDCSRGRRIIENDDGSGRLVRATPTQRHQRPCGREDDRHDQRGAQDQQQQVAELQPASALSLGRAQVADRWEIDLGRNPSLQQVEQCRDRGGGESQKCQRMNEAHVSRRSARPNGMSV
jgi:hypothetical protein